LARERPARKLASMVIDTGNPTETELGTAAAAPVLLSEVTKRYRRRRGAVAALDRVSLSFAAGSWARTSRCRCGWITAGWGGRTSSWRRPGWAWAAGSCGGGRPSCPAASSRAWRSRGR